MNSEGLPETLPELLDYIENYADSIFVRDAVNERWDSYALTELPVSRALYHAFRFIREGRIPVRVLSDAEVEANRRKNER
jgi:hypothetical protein